MSMEQWKMEKWKNEKWENAKTAEILEKAAQRYHEKRHRRSQQDLQQKAIQKPYSGSKNPPKHQKRGQGQQ